MNVQDHIDPCDRYGSLTDRQAIGERLSASELEWAREHASKCSMCGTESAFYTALPGIARTSVKSVVAALPKPRRSRVRALVLLAAALTIGGVAAAELVVLRPFARPTPAVTPTPRPPSVEVKTPAIAPIVAATPAETAEKAEPAPPKRAAVDTDGITADDLLREARAARAAGRAGDAASVYRRLIRQFPQSPQAVPARVSLGDIQLSLGDAPGALASYDAYLASGQTVLTREARYGRIRALGALGRSDDERRDFERFVHDYPSSPQAASLAAKLSPR